ncbi:hypothetical protein [Chryseobacterium sp. JK1]|uniref:hypothetical protein n=1 Tax=Chryseobacterium sp. JK1 TaxID=874294 RepID=UPI003D688D58
MGTVLLILGITSILSGFGILYWIKRRKFNRRNSGGLEGFSSYNKSIFVRLIEWTGRWLAIILLVVGILFLWRHYRHKQQKENKSSNYVGLYVNIYV